MVQAKLTATAAALLLICGCAREGFRFEWRKFPMDGHRTGVTAIREDGLDKALGAFDDSTYISPNGRVFRDGPVKDAAEKILDIQDKMAPLRKEIGHSLYGMTLERPESGLSDWVADAYMDIAATEFGVRPDASICNFGGIRTDMPEGRILLDDIISMFPFRNTLSCVELRGSDLKRIFEDMGRRNDIQPVGGVRLEYEGTRLARVEIGGHALDTSRVYNVVTNDFLLDGGDSISVARNALSLKTGGKFLDELMTDYVCGLTEAGTSIDKQMDGRITIR